MSRDDVFFQANPEVSDALEISSDSTFHLLPNISFQEFESFQISGLRRLKEMFHTFVLCLFAWHVNGAFYGNTCEEKSVMEGDSITLYNFYEVKYRLFMIEWKFGAQESRIVKFYTDEGKILIHNDVLDGMFRGRLEVDDQTGSLTITNITTQHTGLYEMITTSSARISDGIKLTSYKFYVNVYAHLPVPVISSYCPQNHPASEGSSVSKCVLLCSVMNVQRATFSWYKGNSSLSSVSVSDLNSIVSLHLDVEYQDTNTYRCVISHPFGNQTQHVDIAHVCHKCSDCVNCCDTTEGFIRLVVSALVGMAAVAALVVLIYDIRSRREETGKKIVDHLAEATPPSDSNTF
ncbi:uncharacterized protein LOC130429965 [Triplophysa dalaica]|uniref:uncharacterized protein LOC130429965 n=1 Tax=Triplophysa dalaica TaxID=1582913 RepID=UPI0024DFAFFD|nr:uncharacterized protein LOC130429965 [Triplophysa dalaica]